MIRLGIEGLKRVLDESHGFTQAVVVKEKMAEYEEENNPILAFLKDTDVDADIIGEPTSDVYRRYSVFCHENGLTPVGNKVFGKQLLALLGVESVQKKVNGKNRRIYVK